jgi:flagellar hook assembly protein FlgD
VKVLVDRDFKRGEFKTTWDGKNSNGKTVGSGVYFALMRTSNYKAVRKMILLR